MPLDSDIALFGTGIAPLVAATHLLAQGKSVLLLNPDWDFFLEDSELPLDPLLHGPLTPQRLMRSSPESALAELRPDFPGAIEFWSEQLDATGYHDRAAPHVRQRGRLWISSIEKDRFWNWEALEDLYIEASDSGLNPNILEGLKSTQRFPGYSAKSGNFKGLYLPKLCDVDITRYRNGLLEFVRERLEMNRFLCSVTQLECMPEGIRFHSNGTSNTARLNLGMLVFWTPRMSSWIIQQLKRTTIRPALPKGVRLWEQWSLNSREVPDPGIVGMFGDMAVWADIEGMPSFTYPQAPPNGRRFSEENAPRLSVLRSGPLVPLDGIQLQKGGMTWGSSHSFSALSSLCHEFLKWDRFSIRSLRARAIFEWDQEESWLLSEADLPIRVVSSCDGPLVDVVRVARTGCDTLLKGPL